MNYSGKLLVASPLLTDPNFRQTIVLIIQGNDNVGAAGLVLNRISDCPVREIGKQIFQQDCETDSAVYLGGPIFRSMTALHTKEKINGLEVIPGIYFTNSPQDLEQLAEDKNNCSRFFIGAAGWDEGQLSREINEGVWLLVEATHELIFNDDPKLWQHLIEAIGKNVLSTILHTNKFPNDPTLN
jgi:putative transcriptional regulator